MANKDLRLKSEKWAETAQGVGQAITRIALALLNGFFFLFLLILNFFLVHIESTNSAVIVSIDYQYWRMFGFSSFACLTGMIGFTGLVESRRINAVIDDVKNLYPEVTKVDSTYKAVLEDSINDKARQMKLMGWIFIPMSFLVTAILGIAQYQAVPFAVDKLALDYYIEPTTGLIIQGEHSIAFWMGLSVIVTSILSFILGPAQALMSPVMFSERYFLEHAEQRTQEIKEHAGVDAWDLKGAIKKKKASGGNPNSGSSGSSSKQNSSGSSNSGSSSKAGSSNSGSTKTDFSTINDNEANIKKYLGIKNFDLFKDHCFKFAGIDPATKSIQEFAETYQKVKEWIKDNSKGEEPQKAIEHLATLILGNKSNPTSGIFMVLSLEDDIQKINGEIAKFKDDISSLQNLMQTQHQQNTGAQNQYQSQINDLNKSIKDKEDEIKSKESNKVSHIDFIKQRLNQYNIDVTKI
jgi:uncharacterized membrane protein YgcG